jgi:hypothetical protein
MAVLKIVQYTPIKLLDNNARRYDPRRTVSLTILTKQPVKLPVVSVVTLSGTVKNEFSVPLTGRTVRLFSDQSCGTLIANTYTDASGEFSFTIPGCTSSRLTAIAQGEPGENAQIFINV